MDNNYRGLREQPRDILLVEDNAGDIQLTAEVLKDTLACSKLHVVTDGVQALDFLHQRDPHQNAPRPDIILLDLNLPKKKGKDVLRDIKQTEHLKDIPVIIFTTSNSRHDIAECYKYHANCYLTKPVDFYKFVELMQKFQEFWLSVVKLPGHSLENLAL